LERDCRKILKHFYDAMSHGYSKLIIHDLVLPNVGASAKQANFDLATMSITPGMERSAHDFTRLFESAGFKITGIWSFPDKDGILEMEVALWGLYSQHQARSRRNRYVLATFKPYSTLYSFNNHLPRRL
jgi:hypothetical protein